ncbi:VWA domain-containing protein [Archangium sp.]|uniref:VWA domain-containing protein n=1 Tax=Archangium sp. TaxID=1872627 RepID=UPI002D22CF2F|nr:VWA domain-containing protein [Archangium sp.]HYO59801.1 VWA domain-containing protein [Archangium sp.]
MKQSEEERLERWRLVLGEPVQGALGVSLGESELRLDRALAALYDSERKGGLGASSPHVARWLGDIREYFPASVVRVMQGDAMTRLGLTEMLLQPEMLEAVEPDVSLVATLLSLRKVIPQKTKETARKVVRRVVEDLEQRLRAPTERAVRGALSRASRTRRPRAAEINWDRTLRANLGNYQPERKSVVVEKLVGHGRRRSSLRDVVLCIDQSGSMAASVVYASIFGAVLASLRAVSTRMVLFDTAVVDLSEQLSDPVDLLFGTQLGGGTDIDRALAYCQQLVTRPAQTILVLITDLYEGGDAQRMLQRAASLVQSGVRVICLLSLSDQGTPAHDGHNAARLAALGVPTFACTPDLFPELMAAAIQRQDVRAWAARNDIQLARPG